MRAGQGVGGGSAPGAGIAANDAVSRQFRMTVDEARNILNLGKASEAAQGEQSELMQQLLENYERMMKANEKTSHYIQSKIVRARERLEAEYPEYVSFWTVFELGIDPGLQNGQIVKTRRATKCKAGRWSSAIIAPGTFALPYTPRCIPSSLSVQIYISCRTINATQFSDTRFSFCWY